MKISIDLGHQCPPFDIGANGIITEETMINNVGKLVISKLKDLGHTIIETRPYSCTSVGNSLWQRYDKSDDNNCDWCISIHANASDGQGHGTEVFTYGAKEVADARNILNNIVALGFANRGIKDGSNLAMVKRPLAKSMLIEICFCDNQTDIDIYNSVGAEAIANAIVGGLSGQTVNTTGWIKNSTGWWYKNEDGSFPCNCWSKIDNEWYSFDAQGYARQSKWIQDKGYWYWLQDNCSMARNKWLWIDGEAYFFSDGGGMYANCYTPDGYFVDETGAWNSTVPQRK